MSKTAVLKASKGYKIRRKFLDRNDNLIKSLYHNTKTIYGPYLGKDNRYRVVMYTYEFKKFTTQYCCIKMEVKLERRLVNDETVDHIDNNTRNDCYDNLQILSRSEHCKKDIIRVKLQTIECIWCGTKFEGKAVKGRLTKSKNPTAGPFCSRACTGKYGASRSNGGKRLKRVEYKRKYFRLKD